MSLNYSKTLLITAACLISLTTKGAPLWTRALFATRSHDTGKSVFALYVVRQEGLHLTGECSYAQPDGRNDPVAVITGTDTGDADFWPDVTTQVRNDAGQWETIAQPFNRGHRTKLEVKPGEVNQKLPVTLDVFLPLVNKYKFGRLLLSTGETAVFELEVLLERGLDTEDRH